eukprot:CAMPEP_0174722864 /NCGR_PEP_ID=MMETSP1094-20130205/39490_1 /TAXON_ID=156173 /ORGANISM="Chrysochromulina brevifilum, Strain UTEX LB 985" /LENGTH=222 /DNA_ID=CAMNT_0015923807 /DNA_START=41 /DNA_END=709 /DNA_ORIENTATION=+
MRRGRLACHLFALLLVSTTRAPLKLTSNFGQGHEMPSDHRGDEDNISPPISWTGVPKNTESFVFLMDSTTDGSKSGGSKAKTHWLVYDIPKEVKELREELSGAGASDVARLGMKDDAGQAPVVVDPMGSIDGWVDPEIASMQNMIHGAIDASFEDRNRAKEGSNSFGGTYYKGPTKRGSTCTFKLYALSSRLELPRGASREEIIKAMKGKILDKATLTGKVP